MNRSPLLRFKTASALIEVEPNSSTDSEAGSLLFRVEGAITDEIHFNELEAKLGPILVGSRSITFDLGRVTRLSSVGGRNWTRFISQIRVPYSFSRISEPVLDLFNLIPSLLGAESSLVQEVLVPFFCEKCDRSVSEPVALERLFDEYGSFHVPKVTCQKCSAGLIFDSIDSDYKNLARRRMGHLK